MSASERLRELVTENVTDSFDAIFRLHHALPEIVAVVEATELLTPIASVATRQAGINRTPVTKAEAALAALEEKLKP